jgi:hypothetical protein
MDQTKLWRQYIQAINGTIKPGPGQVFHLAYPYGRWSWGGREPVNGSYPYEQWAALNVVPGHPSINLNAQSASSGFDVAYRNWANVLTVGDLGKDRHYLSLQEEVATASNELDKRIDEAKVEWQKETEGRDVDFESWLGSLENSGYQDRIGLAQDDYKAKLGELDGYRQRVQSPVDAILAAYENSDYSAEVTNPASGGSIRVRTWVTDPASPWDYVSSITNGNFGGDATAGTSSSTSFDSESSEYRYTQTNVDLEGGAGALVDGGFFGLEGSAGYNRIDTSDFSSSYRFEIGWQDLAIVKVSPSGWFSGADLASYGRGVNYATGFSAWKNGSDNYFFGSGGALSRIVAAVVVAYRPKVTIEAGSSFASSLEQTWVADAGVEGSVFEVGGLEFGAGASRERKASNLSRSGASVTLESADDWPLILGFISSWTLAP